jgi:hypothetical protein
MPMLATEASDGASRTWDEFEFYNSCALPLPPEDQGRADELIGQAGATSSE